MKYKIGDTIMMPDGQDGIVQDYKDGKYLIRIIKLVTVEETDIEEITNE